MQLLFWTRLATASKVKHSKRISISTTPTGQFLNVYQTTLMLTIIISAVSLSITPVAALHYSLHVGAWGDDSSRGNVGVQTEILTQTYPARSGDFDYFWVGDNLANGAFIQFGYGLEPGVYCLQGQVIKGMITCASRTEELGNSARWQWQYWPNLYGKDFYFGIGPIYSAGSNATWHTYSIEPDSTTKWHFLMDGAEVASTKFRVSISGGPLYVVAEKATNNPQLGRLGPVAFRNMAYLKEDGWHPVDSLSVLRGCAVNTDCTIQNTYGSISLGPNYIVAGSDIRQLPTQGLLWTSGYVTLRVEASPNSILSAKPVYLLSNVSTSQASLLISVPKGEFTNVWIANIDSSSGGVLGILGAKDKFRGWSGDVKTSNTTVRILMDNDKIIRETWVTDYTVPLSQESLS